MSWAQLGAGLRLLLSGQHPSNWSGTPIGATHLLKACTLARQVDEQMSKYLESSEIERSGPEHCSVCITKIDLIPSLAMAAGALGAVGPSWGCRTCHRDTDSDAMAMDD